MPSRICSFCRSLPISKASRKYLAVTKTPSNRSRVSRARARIGFCTTTTSCDSDAAESVCSTFSRESPTSRILGFSDNVFMLRRNRKTFPFTLDYTENRRSNNRPLPQWNGIIPFRVWRQRKQRNEFRSTKGAPKVASVPGLRQIDYQLPNSPDFAHSLTFQSSTAATNDKERPPRTTRSISPSRKCGSNRREFLRKPPASPFASPGLASRATMEE